MLAVGEAMLEGEFIFRVSWRGAAFNALRIAVDRDDALNVTERWDRMHPPRHALAALPGEDGQLDETETAPRADLGLDEPLPRPCRHPDNIRTLTGPEECMRARDDAASWMFRKLELA